MTTFLSFFVVTGRVTANDLPVLHFNYLWGILLFGPWFIALGSTLAGTAAGAIIGSPQVVTGDGPAGIYMCADRTSEIGTTPRYWVVYLRATLFDSGSDINACGGSCHACRDCDCD